MLKDLPLIAGDGNWMFLRNFFASNKPQDLDKLVNSFLSSVTKLVKKDNYESELIILWDKGKWKYRSKDKFPDYKANREYDESFEIAWTAMNVLHEQILPSLGIRSIRVNGLEADDLCYWVSNLDRDVMLHTKDRDWYIAINESTCVLHDVDGLMDLPALREKYKVDDAEDFMLYKAILGDPSDGISGLTEDEAEILSLMSQYKDNTIDKVLKLKIFGNIQMMRLNYIMTDEPVIEEVERQMKVIKFEQRIALTTNKIVPGNYSPQLNPVLGKYNREVTKKVISALAGAD